MGDFGITPFMMPASQTMNIVFASDEKFAPFLATAIVSILLNSSAEDSFSFHILDGGLSESSKSKINALQRYKPFTIKYIDFDFELVKDCPLTLHYTSPVYFRFFMAELVPEADRLLYLDADIIVTGSLFELYNTEFGGKMLGAVQTGEYLLAAGDLLIPIFSSGIMIIDAAAWRKSKISDALMLRTAEIREHIAFVDQDVFNSLFMDNYVHLDLKWNMAHDRVTDENEAEVRIIHFTAKKFSSVRSLFLFLYLSYTGFGSFATNSPEEEHCASLYKDMASSQA